VKYALKEEIFGVVEPIAQGTSLYVLVPEDLRKRLNVVKATQFVVILAENGDIIYRQKNRRKEA
jgi:antitoxin component of MazEF toxin-antitoxin module